MSELPPDPSSAALSTNIVHDRVDSVLQGDGVPANTEHSSEAGRPTDATASQRGGNVGKESRRRSASSTRSGDAKRERRRHRSRDEAAGADLPKHTDFPRSESPDLTVAPRRRSKQRHAKPVEGEDAPVQRNGGISPPGPVPPIEGLSDPSSKGPTVAAADWDNKLVVHIHSAGSLSANRFIVHPFVRVWVVDAATGESLSLAPAGEARCAFSHPFDLREHQSDSPAWEEQVVLTLNVPISDAEAPVLLLELLDFGTIDICGEPIQQPGRPFIPIAWGFLALTDPYGRSNMRRRLHVQLYRAPERRGYFSSLLLGVKSLLFPTVQSRHAFAWSTHSTMAKVPPVFRNTLNFADRNDLYRTCITLNCFTKDDSYVPPEPPLLTVRDQVAMEELLVAYQGLEAARAAAMNGGHPGASALSASFNLATRADRSRAFSALNAAEQRALKEKALSRDASRLQTERNLPPTTPLHSIHVRSRVSALLFSPNSQVLAIALVADLTATVKLYLMTSPLCELVGELHGHVGYIHELVFNKNGTALLTASSDGTARIWSVSSLPVLDAPPANVFAHSSHLYSARFLNDCVLTAGFDGMLNLWSVATSTLLCSTADPFEGCFRRILVSNLSDVNHKFWTLDTLGFFSAWRVIRDAQSGLYSSIEPRRRIQIQGASRAHVEGHTAMLLVPGDCPEIHVLDTISYSVSHVISCGQLPSSIRGHAAQMVTALLPDARTAMVVVDPCSAIAYDLTVGELLCRREGFPLVDTRKGAVVVDVAWSQEKHMCAVAFHRPDAPLGCDIAVVVRPRVESEACLDRDPNAPMILRQYYGGEIRIRPSKVAPGSTTSTGRIASSSRVTPVSARLQAPGGVRPAAGGPEEQQHGPLSRDLQTRFNQIIAWWKGRVAARGTVRGPSNGVALPIAPQLVVVPQQPADVRSAPSAHTVEL